MILFKFLFNSIKSSFRFTYNITRKIFIVAFVFGIVFFLFGLFTGNSRPVLDPEHALQIQRQQMYADINTMQKEPNGKMNALVYKSTMCALSGEACTDNPQDGVKNSKNSVIGMATDMIMIPYLNPPASGTLYAYEKMSHVGVVPETYAAGIEGMGFSSLKMFEPIWLIFRNLTFLILVLILIAIGFMIMFRAKLNPQTVISIENALPKIIFSMLTITFSFAIAGFLIDMMYLSVIIVVNLLSQPAHLDSAKTVSEVLSRDIFGYTFTHTNSQALGTTPAVGQQSHPFVFDLFQIYFNGVYGMFDVLPPMIKVFMNTIIAAIIVIISAKGIATLIRIFTSVGADWTVGFNFIGTSSVNLGGFIAALVSTAIIASLMFAIWGIIIGFIVFVGILILLFRIFFTLLMSYIQILLLVMFAPLFLLQDAIPGQSGFTPWLKGLIGNLAVFPICIALFLIVYVMSQNMQGATGLFNYQNSTNPKGQALNQNPFGNQYAPIAQAKPANNQMFLPPGLILNPAPFIAIINAAFLVLIPDLLKQMKEKIVGKGGLNLPISPGMLVGGVTGAVAGGGMGMLSQFHTISMATKTLGKGFTAKGTGTSGKAGFGEKLKAMFLEP